MKTCPRCNSKKWHSGILLHELEVDGYRFEERQGGSECENCCLVLFPGLVRTVFHLKVAGWFAANGIATGGAFKHMRVALGYTGQQMGAVLRMSPQTISRYEHGAQAVDHHVFVLLGSMVADRQMGHAGTADRLEALSAAAPSKDYPVNLTPAPRPLVTPVGTYNELFATAAELAARKS